MSEGPAVLGWFQLADDADPREVTAEIFGATTTIDAVRSSEVNLVADPEPDHVPVAIREAHLPDRAMVSVLGTDRSREDRLRAVQRELAALRDEVAGEEDGPDWDGTWGYLQSAASDVETARVLEEGPDILEEGDGR